VLFDSSQVSQESISERRFAMLIRILCKQFVWLLVIIGLMPTVTLVRAQGEQPERSLKVVQVWLDSIDKRKPIWVEVSNIDKWAEQHGKDIPKFVLCINGAAYKDFTPILGKDDWLGFQIESPSEFKHMWKNCVTRYWDQKDSKATFTVLYDGTKVAGDATGRISPDPSTLKAFLVAIVIAIIAFAFLAYYSDIIRETGDQPEEGRKRYSLARTQMAWWSLIVLFSYSFIWWLTSDLTVLTSSVLALMGISMGTGLGSAVVDSSRRSEQEKRLSNMEEDKDKVDAELMRLEAEKTIVDAKVDAESAAPAKEQDFALKKAKRDQLSSDIDELRIKLAPASSTNIVQDILSDDYGVSFHRFQIFAWTIVLTFIFVKTVWDGLAMPDFDATLLGLMGLSGGTYIGFKMPNQQG